jgi:hypothetical protein
MTHHLFLHCLIKFKIFALASQIDFLRCFSESPHQTGMVPESHLHRENTINTAAFTAFSSVSLLLFNHVLIILIKVFVLNHFVFILFH